MFVEKRLKPTWDWILTVMDSTEAQLRFGASLTDSTDAAHPLHPSNSAPTSTAAVAPSEYLQFPLSLHFVFLFSLRSQNAIFVLTMRIENFFRYFAFDQNIILSCVVL